MVVRAATTVHGGDVSADALLKDSGDSVIMGHNWEAVMGQMIQIWCLWTILVRLRNCSCWLITKAPNGSQFREGELTAALCWGSVRFVTNNFSLNLQISLAVSAKPKSTKEVFKHARNVSKGFHVHWKKY